MANITIKDTGYPNLDLDGTQESTMANSGTAIELKSVEVGYTRGSNNDDSPIPAKYSDTELNFGSTENPKITIHGILDRTSTADMDLIPELDKLVTTKGIKCLYYNSTTDGYRDLTDSLGTDNTSDNHSLSTPHLHVRVLSFDIRHTSDSTHLRYTLNCEVTA